MLCSSVHSVVVSQISVSGCRFLAVGTPNSQGLRAPVRIQAVTRREIQTEAAALVGLSSIAMGGWAYNQTLA